MLEYRAITLNQVQVGLATFLSYSLRKAFLNFWSIGRRTSTEESDLSKVAPHTEKLWPSTPSWDPGLRALKWDHRVRPYGGTLRWDPKLGPYGETIRWDSRVRCKLNSKVKQTGIIHENKFLKLLISVNKAIVKIGLSRLRKFLPN